ncbi:MAG: hypothetical protein ABSF99_08475 [Anaerolineales bacterium]|jgi:hypothetical protein
MAQRLEWSSVEPLWITFMPFQVMHIRRRYIDTLPDAVLAPGMLRQLQISDLLPATIIQSLMIWVVLSTRWNGMLSTSARLDQPRASRIGTWTQGMSRHLTTWQ